MGIKRRRRETAIAEGKKPLTTRGSSGSRTSQTGGQILAGIFERPFFTRLPTFPLNRFLRQCYNSSKKIMYDPWNLGGLNPSFFVIWGGLAPPSPYVEPPLASGGHASMHLLPSSSINHQPHESQCLVIAYYSQRPCLNLCMTNASEEGLNYYYYCNYLC